MFKDYRYINAGENEIYRWGKKAREKLTAHLQPNEEGFYTIMTDGGKYWTIGTSKGKYGEFAKFGDMIFSVNSVGNMWAKAGTEKGGNFVRAITAMLDEMERLARGKQEDEEEEEQE